MPSGWDVYYLVFLSSALALGIPAALTGLSILSRSKGRAAPRSEGESIREFHQPKVETETRLGRRLNTRFFLGADIALLLIASGLLLIPCVSLVHSDFRGLVGVLSLAVFSTLGLLYAARKGDLDWLKSYKRGDEP